MSKIGMSAGGGSASGGKKSLKKYFLILLLAELFLSYTPAFAQATPYDYSQKGTNPVSSQIEKYLCAPKLDVQSNLAFYNDPNAAFNNKNGGVLFECINRLYKFAIIIACVVGVFFIVIAGYVYMGSEGNAESVEKAKSILTSTITALVILMAGYILLKAINPDLIQFQTIQPPSVSINNLPPSERPAGGGGGGGGPVNTAVCSINKGSCSVSQMSQCTGWDASAASAICGVESSGVPTIKSGSDHCVDETSFSIGLMQINIISSGGAPYMPAACTSGIFKSSNGSKIQTECLRRNSSGICTQWNCQLADPAATQYNACVAALSDPANNLTAACALYKQASGWGPWTTTYNRCTQ